MKSRFPSVFEADEDGLLAVGGRLDPDWLIDAYSQGIFPWPQEGLPILWFCPLERGVLEFSEVHWAKSFLKFLKKTRFRLAINNNFKAVILECQMAPRPGQKGTWITAAMVEAYIRMHELGYAHSFEVYEDDVLVGGVYGVYINSLFSAESMFFKKPNASKFALYHLINSLKESGHTWMDIQMVTSFTESIGGRLVSQAEFISKLKNTELSAGSSSAKKWPTT